MNQTNSIHELVFPANTIDTKLPDGEYKAGQYGTKSYSIILKNNVIVKNGIFITPVYLEGKFKWSQNNLEKEINKGTKVSIKTIAFSPSYEKLEYEPEVPWNLINKSFGVNTNEQAGEHLKTILASNSFSFPKPVSLIKYLINFIDVNVILDFFAGSGTTLHATMQLNAEDGGHRKCILVTNNENGICENVTYERNKRVIQGYTTPKGEEVPGLTANTLRYYKTDFISRDRTQRNMHALVEAATDLLCIKEDLYEEQTHFGQYKTHPKVLRYFAQGSKRMLVLYRDEYTKEVATEIENIELPQDEKIKIYIFSPDRYAYDDMFENVADKVTLVALPAAIYDAYKKVLPKRKEKLLELQTDNNEANEEGGEE